MHRDEEHTKLHNSSYSLEHRGTTSVDLVPSGLWNRGYIRQDTRALVALCDPRPGVSDLACFYITSVSGGTFHSEHQDRHVPQVVGDTDATRSKPQQMKV